jgi:hypothetical protein
MPKFINNFSRPLIVLLVISLVCTGVMTFKHYSTPQNRYKIIEACDLLTPEIAKKVGGQDMPPAPQIKATATGHCTDAETFRRILSRVACFAICRCDRPR